jgi:phage shock protein A
MSDVPQASDEKVDTTAELEQLRSKVKELEAQLDSAKSRAGEAKSSSAGTRALPAVAAVLGVSSVLMAGPAFVTVRRWVRWWRD